MHSRPPMIGLRHLALYVDNLDACEQFYTHTLGMTLDWKPDADNVYLTFGTDNLALHRSTKNIAGPQRLDHLGFFVPHADDVDAWHAWLVAHDTAIIALPKTHRDGARSFYCKDPAGNALQFLHMPNTHSA